MQKKIFIIVFLLNLIRFSVYAEVIKILDYYGIAEYKTENNDWKIIDEKTRNLEKGYVQTSENSRIQYIVKSTYILLEPVTIINLLKRNKIELHLGTLKVFSEKNQSYNIKCNTLIVEKIYKNTEFKLSYDYNRNIYLNVYSGKIKIEFNGKTKYLIKNFYKISGNKLTVLDNPELRFELKNISVKENKYLRDFIIPQKKIKNKKVKKQCRVTYFFPKPDKNFISSEPYGLVIFNSSMNKKSVESCIFEISDGFKTTRESLRNMKFLGVVSYAWSNNNKTLTIYPNKKKLVNGRKYYLQFVSNNGKDINGNKLFVDNYKGYVTYRKK